MADFRLRIPNTTQVPNVVLDTYLSTLSGAELKVLLYLIRRTYGFQKDSDAISISQLMNGITTRDGRVLDTGTGLSRQAVVNALKRLGELELIQVEKKTDDITGNQTNVYTLVIHSTEE